MLRIDKAILDTDKVICENIKCLATLDRGLLSQNILAQIRNFVEYIAIKEFSSGQDINPNDYNLRKKALKDMEVNGKFRFLYKFHEMLQKSVSHYTVDPDGSERLMLKYYEHLLRIKIYLKQTHAIDVLGNIEDFPLNTDTELSDYYQKIAERIEVPSSFSSRVPYNDRFYIQKIKPFFVNKKIFYEITFTIANEKASKFDRMIAFTNCEIIDNYAIKFSIHKDIIHILDKNMTILIIDSFEVSIRPCEWENLSKILGNRIRCITSSHEYQSLMLFLSTIKMSLTEFVCNDQDYYDSQKRLITKNQSFTIFKLLDQCRDIVIKNKNGSNILRYLLHRMNNRLIKWQYSQEECALLSNLHLKFSCIPFDEMPYCTSLPEHNPPIHDLFESISINGREHEILARLINNNTEIEGHLFTPMDEIEGFNNIHELILKYNRSLYRKHAYRRLEIFNNHIYKKEHVDNTTNIIRKLQALASSGVPQYTMSVDSWLAKHEYYKIDDDKKKDALREMFANSKVALIYGSAGTGKSTFLKHVANFWSDIDKKFLANTHPAVDNMRRKVNVANSKYDTIAKFINKHNSCDILFIDECSTVNNNDMKQVLEKTDFKLLVLVGDIYQIESILFGNWFSIAQKFIPKTSIFELLTPYRTKNNDLLIVWNRVRNIDDSIEEFLVKNNYVARLDETIFEHNNDDEIILCLNYDGLYGINNINRFLQNNNPHPEINWGVNSYKVDDPILFNESNRFSPLIYNNSKGKIVGIHKEEQKIQFLIELDETINGIDASNYDFELIGSSESGHSIISFYVNKLQNSDNDNEDNDLSIVPFQVAYAISIHKAQGLEYDSVKIVITNEFEERITHNIFYTAITRTKNKLKIYWSPETERSIIANFKIKNPYKDAYLLAQLSRLNMIQR